VTNVARVMRTTVLKTTDAIAIHRTRASPQNPNPNAFATVPMLATIAFAVISASRERREFVPE
jgi:hypothetical protein